jgi:hypothetical protein
VSAKPRGRISKAYGDKIVAVCGSDARSSTAPWTATRLNIAAVRM